jgi:hypothetical protein
MDKKLSSDKKAFQMEDSNLKKGIEIRNHKIMPRIERREMRRFAREDEWEQEYYIIYNSYVLEEKEPD